MLRIMMYHDVSFCRHAVNILTAAAGMPSYATYLYPGPSLPFLLVLLSLRQIKSIQSNL